MSAERPVYQAYLSWTRMLALPPRSREQRMAELSVRGCWHALFDPCPKLLQGLCPPDGAELFERFLGWADEAKPAMGWCLHLDLLRWLLQDARYGPAVTDEMIVETLAAAASRWAIYDRSLSGGLVLGCERLGERVVAGWKCHSTEEGRTVTLHRLASPPQLGAFLACFTLEGFSLRAVGPWAPIPG